MTVSLSAQMGLDETRTQVFDFSVPAWAPDGQPNRWPNIDEMPWVKHQRALEARIAALQAEAERLLSLPDATSALKGIGFAILALKAELELEDARRDR
jgi:hypothetical protein